MRTRSGVYFDLTDTADDRFDPVIEWLLVGLLALLPLSLGAVHAWSEMLFVAGAGAMALCLAAKLLRRPNVRFIWNWTYLPIAAFVLLVGFQILPLPAWMARLVAPGTVTLKTELLQSIPESASHLRRIPLSFYPEGTWHDLRLLFAVGTVFVVCVNVVRRMEQVRRILAAVTVVGVLVAAIALVQDMLDARGIYFLIPTYNTTSFFGPFANHSHYGQFMNLSIGAALALLLIHIGQLPRGRAHAELSLARHLARPVTRPVWLLGCAVAFMVLSVVVSHTRGGVISLAVAGAMTSAVLARHRELRRRAGILFAGIALFTLVGVLSFRFEQTYQRIASLRDFDTFNGRVEIVRDIARAWRQFPLFGTGLGTFEMVFPGFDRSTILSRATHAENEYAQLLFETGVIGVLLTLTFLALVARAYIRCVRTMPSPMGFAAAGMGFGLVAILTHSLTDFGQHLPANAMLTAIFCAMILNMSQSVRLGAGTVPKALFRGQLRLRVAGAIATTVIACVMVLDAASASRAESHWNRAARIERSLQQRNWVGDSADFYHLILPASAAVQLRPGNIVYATDLNYFRWQSIADARTDEERTARAAHARRIVDDLLSRAWQCPTYAPAYWLAGSIEGAVLSNSPRSDALTRIARRLAPAHPGIVVDAAVVEARGGNLDDAMEQFRHAAQIDPGIRPRIIDVLVVDLSRPRLAVEFAGDDPALLRQVALLLDRRTDAQSRSLAQEVRQLAGRIIETRAELSDAAPEILVEAARLRISGNDPAGAAKLLRRALQREYARADRRLELARALAAAGDVESAIQEARIVQRGHDRSKEAEQLIAQLTLQLSASSQPTTAASQPNRVLIPRPRESR